jgi:hypothetical protein
LSKAIGSRSSGLRCWIVGDRRYVPSNVDWCRSTGTDVSPLGGPAVVRVRRSRMLDDEDSTTMKRHRHTPEKVVRNVREGERLLNEGKDPAEVLRHLEISELT